MNKCTSLPSPRCCPLNTTLRRKTRQRRPTSKSDDDEGQVRKMMQKEGTKAFGPSIPARVLALDSGSGVGATHGGSTAHSQISNAPPRTDSALHRTQRRTTELPHKNALSSIGSNSLSIDRQDLHSPNKYRNNTTSSNDEGPGTFTCTTAAWYQRTNAAATSTVSGQQPSCVRISMGVVSHERMRGDGVYVGEDRFKIWAHTKFQSPRSR